MSRLPQGLRPPMPASPVAEPIAQPIHWQDPAREAAFWRWLRPLLPKFGLDPDSLVAASADASFRRYFRLRSRRASSPSMVVMDAPPPLEDVRPFVDIAGRIRRAGLNGPEILAADTANGFLLLSDLGQTLYLDALQACEAAGDPAGSDRLMRDAIAALLHWQHHLSASGLPDFDEALLQRELALFPQWCVQTEFGIDWTAAQRAVWDRLCQRLVDSALAQPKVAVHRDWMPRNLMVSRPNPGILDFQDAVRGPVTYDLACLLRDAFISWDEERQLDWAARWWAQARKTPLLQGHAFADDFGECWRATEWLGLQRHLKVMGIFCRLKHRDGKPHYAADLPRFLRYATQVALRYVELKPLMPLIEPLGQRLGLNLTTTGFSLR